MTSGDAAASGPRRADGSEGGRRGYRARAAVTAEAGPAGVTRITRLRSDGPLALRETAEAVYLVGAAAGPLGGDVLELDVEVGAGARLAVRSAATSLALPGGGPDGDGSRLAVRAAVGPGGRLDFAPEPVVAAAGCRHRATAAVALADGAALRWREELVLGRHGERPGRHASRLDVTYGGVPLLRHELALDERGVYGGPAVLGTARAVGSLLLVGPGLAREARTGDGLSVLPLAGPGVLVTAVADDSAELRRRLVRGEMMTGPDKAHESTAAVR
ncbi:MULTISPECIES: urease accessory protein UreD [Actinomadura]|uniref:Urease accessory protein UreD n=1 Tax=Actinomadura yumaensis TaxID=111807 RepID=A0ABW2CKN4_9ACTN|nr:urease accessory protein UreD [Actinomadura sp. J1-007]MWK33061.1 urease accessory protein UreD [Actinomadura sp. J1-007]